jgi:hypothetical protein
MYKCIKCINFIMYKIIICIVLIIYIKKLFTYKIQTDVIPDIVVAAGGRNGFYSLGICHYLRNNFDVTDKKSVGFSAGSWCSFILTMKKELINEFLNKIFLIDKNTKVNVMLDKVGQVFSGYSLDDFNTKNNWIAITNITKKKLCLYNEFISIEDCVRCCKSSSFIPLLTSKHTLSFYKNDLSFDGAIMYKKFKKTLPNTTLIISHKMFGRNQHAQMYKEIYRKKNIEFYNSYITGYNDASKNHKYFKNYLKEL